MDDLVVHVMEDIRLHCDHCGQEHMVYRCSAGDVVSGYYEADDYWSRFFPSGEKRVCDLCMWKSEAYRAVYGDIIP